MFLCAAVSFRHRTLPPRDAAVGRETARPVRRLLRMGARGGLMTENLLDVVDLKTHFPVRKGLLSQTVGYVCAVDGITFSIGRGETLGLVGESGCGKSTAGKTILRLIEPTSGSIRIDGQRIDGLSRAEMRAYRRELQVVFQDP